MPPRAFPFSLRVGIDICSIPRVRQILSRPGKPDTVKVLNGFLNRVLTLPERAYFFQRFGGPAGASNQLGTVSQYLAGRFAAKEAIRKACVHMGRSKQGLHDIVILPVVSSSTDQPHSGPPRGLVLDRVRKWEYHKSAGQGLEQKHASRIVTENDLEGQLCEVSISHDGDYATAAALVPLLQKAGTEDGTAGASFKRVDLLLSTFTEQTSQDALEASNSDGAMKEHGERAAATPISSTTNASLSDDDEGEVKRHIGARKAELERRNHLVGQIEALRAEEHKVKEREQRLYAETTPEEKSRWKLFYTDKEGLTVSSLPRKKEH